MIGLVAICHLATRGEMTHLLFHPFSFFCNDPLILTPLREENNMQAKYFLILFQCHFYLGYLPMPKI